MLFNEPKLLKSWARKFNVVYFDGFSALQRAEIAEIPTTQTFGIAPHAVSVLFNEPKLLKFSCCAVRWLRRFCFSALQRAEIAEISNIARTSSGSAGFSALQRAEIAEMLPETDAAEVLDKVSVLFNEPKLLKSPPRARSTPSGSAVSVLFNEPKLLKSAVMTRW